MEENVLSHSTTSPVPVQKNSQERRVKHVCGASATPV